MLLKTPLKFMTTETANLLTEGAARQQKWHSDDKSVDGRSGCVNRNGLQTTNLLTVGVAASTEMTSRQQIC